MVLTDGAHHPVDSSDWAFYQCAQFAMGDCSTDGVWQVLEPVMKVECTGPEEFQVNILTYDVLHSDIINCGILLIVNSIIKQLFFSRELVFPLCQKEAAS